MAVTVTYEHPVAGGAAPTAAQALGLVTANIIDTSTAIAAAVVSHNMNLSVAELALGFPQVILTPLFASVGNEAIGSDWVLTAKAANTVSLAKVSGAGTGSALPQLRVHVLRPHTIGQ
jgi:hypothetical protein